MKVYTTFILTSSASITRGVTYAKLTHTVARGRYTTAPHLFPATSEITAVTTLARRLSVAIQEGLWLAPAALEANGQRGLGDEPSAPITMRATGADPPLGEVSARRSARRAVGEVALVHAERRKLANVVAARPPEVARVVQPRPPAQPPRASRRAAQLEVGTARRVAVTDKVARALPMAVDGEAHEVATPAALLRAERGPLGMHVQRQVCRVVLAVLAERLQRRKLEEGQLPRLRLAHTELHPRRDGVLGELEYRPRQPRMRRQQLAPPHHRLLRLWSARGAFGGGDLPVA